MALLFAADNVDHNIVTLDGKGTFHGMGMIVAITPGKPVSHTIPRVYLNILNEANVEKNRFAKHVRRNVNSCLLHCFATSITKSTYSWRYRYVSVHAPQTGRA